MSEKVFIDEQIVVDIADTLREKTSTSNLIKPTNYINVLNNYNGYDTSDIVCSATSDELLYGKRGIDKNGDKINGSVLTTDYIEIDNVICSNSDQSIYLYPYEHTSNYLLSRATKNQGMKCQNNILASKIGLKSDILDPSCTILGIEGTLGTSANKKTGERTCYYNTSWSANTSSAIITVSHNLDSIPKKISCFFNSPCIIYASGTSPGTYSSMVKIYNLSYVYNDEDAPYLNTLFNHNNLKYTRFYTSTSGSYHDVRIRIAYITENNFSVVIDNYRSKASNLQWKYYVNNFNWCVEG